MHVIVGLRNAEAAFLGERMSIFHLGDGCETPGLPTIAVKSIAEFLDVYDLIFPWSSRMAAEWTYFPYPLAHMKQLILSVAKVLP